MPYENTYNEFTHSLRRSTLVVCGATLNTNNSRNCNLVISVYKGFTCLLTVHIFCICAVKCKENLFFDVLKQ